jgi:hypothetical protein
MRNIKTGKKFEFLGWRLVEFDLSLLHAERSKIFGLAQRFTAIGFSRQGFMVNLPILVYENGRKQDLQVFELFI